MAPASLAGCGADCEEDEQQNLAILRQLPTFPGALELAINTTPYFGDEEGLLDRAEGHTTLLTYRTPAGTTQRELVRFYRSRLEKPWECEVERSGVIDIAGIQPRRRGVLLQLGCSSDTASISVNPDNLTEQEVQFRCGRRPSRRPELTGSPARASLTWPLIRRFAHNGRCLAELRGTPACGTKDKRLA